MKGEPFQQQQSKDVFGITMTEVMLLFVFGFQVIINTMSPDLKARAGESEDPLSLMGELVDYRSTVEGILDRMGTTLDSLPKDWNRLVESQKERNRLAKEKAEFALALEGVKGPPKKEQPRSGRKLLPDPDLAPTNVATGPKGIAGQGRKIAEPDKGDTKPKGDAKSSSEDVGRDKPSCWKDANRDPQFALSITMYEVDFVVDRAWPDSRDNEALFLGLKDMSLGKRITEDKFLREYGFSYRKTLRQDCRLYVYVADQTISKETYKRKLGIVEGYFYKAFR